MRGVSDHRHKFGEFPTLETFAMFLHRESDIASDPVLSMQIVASVREHYVSHKFSDKSFVYDIHAAKVKFGPFCRCEYFLYQCLKDLMRSKTLLVIFLFM